MRLPCLFLLAATSAAAADRIALIEFFGYQGLDVEAVRKALPVHEGGEYSDKDEAGVREAVKQVTGAGPTEVGLVCCDGQGAQFLFIGLPGKSTRTFRLLDRPTGRVRLSAEMMQAHDAMDKVYQEAMHAGGDAAQERLAHSYREIRYPPAHAVEAKVREYALAHEAELEDVLEHSSSGQQRGVAADCLGYADPSPRQIAALARASRDENGFVRNEATRALAEIVMFDPAVGAQISAGDFIEMASSGIWADRNKGAWVLQSLTRSRDPKLLAQIESQAWEALLEMARWRTHAGTARIILGRIKALPEERIVWMSMGTPQAFLEGLGLK
jgi:hypothetical protein